MSPETTSPPTTREEHKSLEQDDITLDSLITSCRSLLSELETFQSFLKAHGAETDVEARPFRNAVASELKSLERLSTNPSLSADKTQHALRSSNLPFHAAVWAAARSSNALVAFHKRFYWAQPPALPRDAVANKGRTPKKCSALVDVVAEEGTLWIKVSTISEGRLLFELAKAGWEGGSDSDEDDEEEDDEEGEEEGREGKGVRFRDGDSRDGAKVAGLAGPGVENILLSDEISGESGDDEDGRVELVKMAEDLRRAARATRVRYRHPRVRFVLPKIVEGNTAAIDAILASIRSTGAAVICQNDLDSSSLSTSSQEARFLPLLPPTHPPLGSTLNLDCTLLLALASDLSHLPPNPSSATSVAPHHPSVVRQLAIEATSPLLPTTLYPTFAGRKLVTSVPAAKRMMEIVAQIGTQTEVERAELLLGTGRGKGMERGEWGRKWGALTRHEGWEGVGLPVETVDMDMGKRTGSGQGGLEGWRMELEEVVETEAQLSEVNKGVLWLGWRMGWVTVSSNRAVAKTVERVVDRWLNEREEGGGKDAKEGVVVGPEVWICGVARSLMGKELGRK